MVSNAGTPSQNRTGPALLELEEVSFGYEADQPVVKDVSFTIHRGEMVSLVGKNGAGKSTLTRLICGYIRPQQGTMHLKGQSMQDLSIKERAYTSGYVSQHPNQMISKPMIMEEVGLGLKWRGIPEKEIEERVHEALIPHARGHAAAQRLARVGQRNRLEQVRIRPVAFEQVVGERVEEPGARSEDEVDGRAGDAGQPRDLVHADGTRQVAAQPVGQGLEDAAPRLRPRSLRAGAAGQRRGLITAHRSAFA